MGSSILSLATCLVLVFMFDLDTCYSNSSYWGKIKRILNRINPLSIDTRPKPVINLDYLRSSLKNIEELIYDSSNYVQAKTHKMSSKVLAEIREELVQLQFSDNKLETQFNMTAEEMKKYQDSYNKLCLRLDRADEMLRQTSPSVPSR
uniref:Uncharacterized protein n=1 Tax=Graphocephala atropunctata TaxID=36148 RepID=A0A1B6MCI5_9HEMI